ncbi:MAG: glycosyltransferase family 2 protein [Deltaproteobacteria bacterium]|nr:glycosyltransferase family 2 protein [Deltaproteobacteria bacterium]
MQVSATAVKTAADFRSAVRVTDRFKTIDFLVKLFVPLGLLVSLWTALEIGSLSGYLALFSSQTYHRPLVAVGAAYSLAFLVFQAVRTYFWCRYRPFPLPPGRLPKVTVIIPAYNEGAMVEKALYSVASADYPADRLEIFCIDDGSKDDTWKYMQRAQSRFPELIGLIRFPKNRGKREALYAGFTQGTGEYFVTVDSDSVVAPDTLKQIVAPMLQDPEIGAVAGNVKVYNRSANLITRMLWVRFVLSFDFLRASQSGYRFVFCTPGALSAYRRAAIAPVLEEWRHQTFLGSACTIGEDRAFTNLVLRRGYHTVYQRSAVVYTTVPETYQGMCRMFLRWDRSNFRESFIQLTYMFTRYRQHHRVLPILDFFVRELEFPLSCIFVPVLLVTICLYPLVLIKFVTALALISFILTIYYIRVERDMDFVYGVVYSFYAFLLLKWIRPFAFLTLKNGRWLTR